MKNAIFILLLMLSFSAQGQTCHFIVFCDTDDSRLMVPTSQSYAFFADELPERVKKYTGMNVVVHSYRAGSFLLSNLENKLSSLYVGSDDVIFFWYDGHGYNAGDNAWPTLSFKQSYTRSLQSIYNALSAKNARLLVVMANACNKERGSRNNYAQHNYVVQNQSDAEIAERYKDLFLRSRGTAMVCSSQKGEVSSSGQFGAWFFLAFREHFDAMVDGRSSGAITWEQLIINASIRTKAIADDAGYTQSPSRYVAITGGGSYSSKPATTTTSTPSGSKPVTTLSGSTTSPPSGGINIEMVYVQGGSFTMGCTAEQGSDCNSDEKPAHTVRVDNFYIGKYEVTQAQWRAVMGNSPSYFKNCDQCPVESVSWDDIQEFIRKLNAQTGKRYRLPTEAEWEYAARGGNQSKGYKYAGSNNIGDVAEYDGNNNKSTRPVGGKRPNELGIYDMSGNVYEWCSDWYADNYYANSSAYNPQGASGGSSRVLRGGSWYSNARGCRVAFRNNYSPSYRHDYYGFRLCL